MLQQQQHARVLSRLHKPGDTVHGRVLHSNPQGARVQLLLPDGKDAGVCGFMPREYNPSVSRALGAQQQQQQQDRSSRDRVLSRWQLSQGGMMDPRDSRSTVVLARGHCRSFKVVAASRGGAPLLSAADHDRALMLLRMQQLQQLGTESLQSCVGRVVGYNQGGLLLSVAGYEHAFMPLSLIARRASNRMVAKVEWGAKEIEEHLLGRDMQVAVVEVSIEQGKVIVSERAARDMQASRVLVAGHMVEGAVKEVVRRGVVVQLAAVSHEALLPWERISQQSVAQPQLQAEFRQGERVVALLLSAAPKNLRLSTMELEQQPGDMLSSEVRAERFQAMSKFVVS